MLVHTDQHTPDTVVIEQAVELFKQGSCVVFPTDSVYGIGAAALPQNPGVSEIFRIKRRPATQTLPWLVASSDALSVYGVEVRDYAYRLAKSFWPGALTLVVKASNKVAPEYRDPYETIALRMPASPLVCKMIEMLDTPLATTSANVHGEPSATCAAELSERLITEAPLVIDGGSSPVAVASTIVDCTGDTPRILREGALSEAIIREVAGV